MHRSGFRPFLFWKISKGKSHSEVSANFNGHLDFAQFLNQSKDTAYVILNRKDQIEYIEFEIVHSSMHIHYLLFLNLFPH